MPSQEHISIYLFIYLLNYFMDAVREDMQVIFFSWCNRGRCPGKDEMVTGDPVWRSLAGVDERKYIQSFIYCYIYCYRKDNTTGSFQCWQNNPLYF